MFDVMKMGCLVMADWAVLERLQELYPLFFYRPESLLMNLVVYIPEGLLMNLVCLNLSF